MTFTLRLTADLTLALAARVLGNKNTDPLILQLSLDTDFQISSDTSSGSARPGGNGPSQSGALVPRYRSPILWIAGPEPLDYPEVARFTNALAASDRHVFLQTSGAALKRRLHEFQPSSRFYFTIRFDRTQPLDEHRSGEDGAYRVGLEAIRMARLAGFFTCAHLVAGSEVAACDLEALHAEISKLDVNGILITSATREPGLEKSVKKLRRRLLSRRWSLLSDLVESAARPSASPGSRQIDRQPVSETGPGGFEEGTEAG
jgi:hypothetical protein